MSDTLPLIGQEPVDLRGPEPGDERYWSVTTIIGCLDKPALVPWAAIETAKAAVENEAAWRSRLANEGKKSAIDYLKGARFRRPPGQRSAAELGQAVHAACETYALSGERPTVDHEVRPFLEQFDAFLQEFTPSYDATEVVVYNRSYGYAGQCDAFLRIDGVPLIADYKTSREGWDTRNHPKTPYPEVGLQLSAYRYAELAAVWQVRRFESFHRRYYLLSDAERAMGVRVPEVEGGIAIFLSPTRYGVYPIRCDEAVFERFLHIQESARWVFEMSKTAVGAPMIPPHAIPDEGDPFAGLPQGEQ